MGSSCWAMSIIKEGGLAGNSSECDGIDSDDILENNEEEDSNINEFFRSCSRCSVSRTVDGQWP